MTTRIGLLGAARVDPDVALRDLQDRAMKLETAAKRWIKYWRSKETLEEGFVDVDGAARVDDLVREDADRGLQVILLILEGIDPQPTSSLFQVLAAGPLEGLLVHHGPAVIDRVEQLAADDRRFNLLLGGVWPSSIAPEVWARVVAIRGEVW